MWRDASLDSDHEATLDQPTELVNFGGMATCRDIGWLVSKNKKEVRLAVGQILDNNSVRHANTIPAGWIREIIYLKNPFLPASEAENAPSNSPI